MVLANVDVAAGPTRKKHRGVARFTVEIFENIFDLPEDMSIVNVSFNPDRYIITFHLESEKFEQTHEGQEAPEYVATINNELSYKLPSGIILEEVE